MGDILTTIKTGERGMPIGQMELREDDQGTVSRLPCITAKMIVGHVAGAFTVMTIPAGSVLEYVLLVNSVAFVGCTLDLGVAGAASSVVKDADIDKTLNADPEVLELGKYFAAETALILTVGAGGSVGAGVLMAKVSRFLA
jgi:hypothetical protein